MASLAETLYTLSGARLRALVQTRGIHLNKLSPTPSKRQLVQFLAGELSNTASVSKAVVQCNARDLRLLQLLAVGESGKETPWSDLVEAAGGPVTEDALSEILGRLEPLGLAFRGPNGVLLPEAVRAHVPASLPDRWSLARCLNSYDLPTLKRVYDRLELGPTTDPKPRIIDAIRDHLLRSASARRLDALDEQEKAVLEYLVQVGGWAGTDVAGAVLDGHLEDFFRYDWQNRWKQGHMRNAVDRLLARGMIFVVSHMQAFNLYLVIPGDLLRVLANDINIAFWTSPPYAPSPSPDPAGAPALHTGCRRDVVSLFAHLATQGATRTNTGHIHKSSLKNLSRTLTLPDERYAAFLYALCREAQFIAPHGDKQVYGLTDRGEAWLYADPLVQIQALYNAWRDGIAWAEMVSDPLMKTGDYRSRESVLTLRAVMLEIAASGSTETFTDIGSLADVLTYRHPLRLAQSQVYGVDLVASPIVFVRRLVAECLYWLGAVELDQAATYRAAQGLTSAPAQRAAAAKAAPTVPQPPIAPDAVSYRLTPLGAHLLGLPEHGPPEPEPREDKFILQPTAEVYLSPYLDAGTRYQLLLMTEFPAKDTTGNVVRLTRESIRRMLDYGLSERDVLMFLQTSVRTGIPQNIEYLINEVAAKHGHIHVGRAQMYLQVNSPLLLQELQARREIKPFFDRAIGDTVALLKTEDEEKVLRELRKAGYLPVSDDERTPLRHPLLTAQNAPKLKVAAAPAQKKASPLPADTLIDWERITRDDDKPWNQEKPVVSRPTFAGQSTLALNVAAGFPPDAVRHPTQIQTLLSISKQNGRFVEICYRTAADEDYVLRRIVPRAVVGDILSANDTATGAIMTLNLGTVTWARLVD